MEKIRVVLYGCGVMGLKIARALLDKKSFEIVGAVDVNPKLLGKDLGEILALRERVGVIIERDAVALFSKVQADAVIHATASHLKTVVPQITPCLQAGRDVVSTCEELSYPWKRHPERARELDALARERGATVVGTGINPGYLMDALPLALTAPCLRVNSIRVTRMMNSARRRLPFQEKVGTGLSVEEFRENIRNKSITGHVGLLESIHMIAAGLGWELDEVAEAPPEPVIAKEAVKAGVATVTRGRVIGLKSRAYAKRGGEQAITLEFCAHAAVEEEYDEILIRGEPDIHQRIVGGVQGDTGTVAMAINSVPRVLEASPGLKSMKDLPMPVTVR